ncbi:MAG: putative Ig domain-containing protein [Aliidongia sp.]
MNWIAATILLIGLVSALSAARAQPLDTLAPDISPAFASPTAITVDSKGNVFVVDSSGTTGQAIRKILAPDYTTATYIAGTDSDSNPFDTISGIAFDGSDNLFVIDAARTQIRELTAPNYATATVVSVSQGLGLTSINGIAADTLGNVFFSATDGGLALVYMLSADQQSVNLVSGFSAPLTFPAGVTVDGSDDIFVADTSGNRVGEITASNQGEVETLPAGAVFHSPNGIAITPNGDLIVTNAVNPGVVNRIEAPAYTTVDTIRVPANAPHGVAVDKNGNIFIADTGDNQVKEVLNVVAVDSISPSAGVIAGGTTVTITGYDFAAGATVKFGTQAAASVTVNNETSITAIAPAGSAGTVDITVTTAAGTSLTSTADQYTYAAPPVAGTAIAATVLTENQPSASFTPVTTTGGVMPLSYGVSPTLPAGLTMAPATGTITGVPGATLAQASFTVTVADAADETSMASFDLAVNAPVTVNAVPALITLTEGHVAAALMPVTASGGTGTLQYAITTGTLPNGLAYGAGGVLSGTATASRGATLYTITATDSNGATAQQNFTLTVNGPIVPNVAIAAKSLTADSAAVPFTPVTATGGTPALSFGVSPPLPAGLGMAPATGTISGTPSVAATAGSYTVTVTDANGATATADFSLEVGKIASLASVRSSADTSSFGEDVTFTASIAGAGPVPTGTVTFKDGGATLFTGTLANGISSYTTASLAPGNHAIIVAYGGDGIFAASAGELTQLVNSSVAANGTYIYQGTLGTPGVTKPDNSHFSSPAADAIDTVNLHLLIVDSGNQRVQVLDAGTLVVVATLGTAGVSGRDNAHFDNPTGVGFDAGSDHIFVTDSGNDRIQVFDGKSFAYVVTLGDSGSDNAKTAATGDTGFSTPGGIHVDAATGRLYVADTGNQRVQIFDAATLAYVGTLGTAGAAGSDEAHFNAPKDATVNPAANEILVADSGNSRVQRFDALSFAYKGTIGGAGLGIASNTYLGRPVTVSYDPASILILVADDSADQRIQVFDAMSYDYVLTLGTTGSTGSSNNQLSNPSGIAVDPAHGRLFVGDQQNDRVQVFSVAPTTVFASVLPGSRSVQLGHPATIFASLVNAGATALQGCQPALPVTAPAGLTLSYQTTDPATNALTGTPDTPAAVAPGNGVQSFLLNFEGSEAFSAPGMAIDFGCQGVAPAAVETGVDTIDLAMTTSPVADIIALVATVSNDGIARIPSGGASAFAVASSNVGAASQIIVSVDTGMATLPLTATLCQSNPSTGACLATPSPTVTLSDAAGSAPTFSVFLQAAGPIPFAPAKSRVFVRFKDPAGGLHGSTGVAIETE